MNPHSQTNGSRRRDGKGRTAWKQYVTQCGLQFTEQSSRVIKAEDCNKTSAKEIVFKGFAWIPSCELSRALPIREREADFRLNGDDATDGGATEEEEEMIVLRLCNYGYRCHRSVMRRSAYLDTLLSMRWMEEHSPNQPILLQLDEHMFQAALYTLYGWVPCPDGVAMGVVESLDWLNAVADFLALPDLTRHLRTRVERVLLPEALALGRLMPIEDLLRLLPVLPLLGVERPARLSHLDVAPLWWRSPTATDALMALAESERALLLRALSRQRGEANFRSWFELFQRLDVCLDKTRDASRRGHERRDFLLKLRAELMDSFALHLKDSASPALQLVARIRLGVADMRNLHSWDSAEEVCREVTARPVLAETFLAAQEALLNGGTVDEMAAEVQTLVHKTLRIHLPMVMQTDAWKSKRPALRKALLREFNFFGTESGPKPSGSSARPARLAISQAKPGAVTLSHFYDDKPLNAKFVSTLSQQVMSSFKTKEKVIDLSQFSLPPPATFTVSLCCLPTLVWIRRADESRN